MKWIDPIEKSELERQTQRDKGKRKAIALGMQWKHYNGDRKKLQWRQSKKITGKKEIEKGEKCSMMIDGSSETVDNNKTFAGIKK